MYAIVLLFYKAKQRERKAMKAIELHEHFKGKGHWVNWDRTCDGILWGDGRIEVQGIAVCWSSNVNQLKDAQRNGCNLYICHEPLYHYSERGEIFHQKEIEKNQFHLIAA